MSGGLLAACDDQAHCQGSRGMPLCEAHRCTTQEGVPDDSACGKATVASECGHYKAVSCNGQSDQLAPSCPTSCSDSSECDPDSYCADGVCAADETNGGTCGADGDCTSGHCNHGLCCSDGDCCKLPEDCPDSYRSAAVCDDETSCQGTRADATCTDFVCGTQEDVADDSACGVSIIAQDCGYYSDRACNGEEDQSMDACASSCSVDADCDADAHCYVFVRGTCVADLSDGSACSRDAQCETDHCQNGYCCGSGDCCKTATNCSVAVYGTSPTCDSPSSCQGHRVDPLCISSQCSQGSSNTPDDSGCAGRLANTCGNYANVFCSGAISQDPNQSSHCGSDCSGDQQCDPGVTCTNNACGG